MRNFIDGFYFGLPGGHSVGEFFGFMVGLVGVIGTTAILISGVAYLVHLLLKRVQ